METNLIETNVFLKNIEEHSIDQIEMYKQEFAKYGYVKVSPLLTNDTIDILIEESNVLMDKYAKRKDFLMYETESTPRKISTVSGNIVNEESGFISSLYKNSQVVEFLEEISGNRLFETPDIADRHAIHKLHRKNDIHGGHVDTYPYVLITCLESPGRDGGGELEFVPNSLEIKDLGTEKSIKDILLTGESYFMRADKSVHRVLPLRKETNRTVLVFTYADLNSKNIEISYSSNKLYD